jgi:hypothetical protein
MNTRKNIIIFLLSLSILDIAPSYGKFQIIKDKEERTGIWKKMLADYPINKKSIELFKRRDLPNENNEKQEIYIEQPKHVAQDKYGNIFISDIKGHHILKFDAQSNFIKYIGRRGQGPGEFYSPNEVFITKDDKLVVSEAGNMRVQYFDLNGQYIRSFKLFKGYLSWTINEKGEIYAIPRLADKNSPLIEVLDNEGKIARSFGKPIYYEREIQAYNDAIINISEDGKIIIAFRFVPLVRIYSQLGEMLNEFYFNQPITEYKYRYNQENQKRLSHGERVMYKPVIFGMYLLDRKIYLMGNYPRLELWEFDYNGKMKSQYWYDIPNYDYYIENFVLNRDKDKIVIYIAQFHPEAKIDILMNK